MVKSLGRSAGSSGSTDSVDGAGEPPAPQHRALTAVKESRLSTLSNSSSSSNGSEFPLFFITHTHTHTHIHMLFSLSGKMLTIFHWVLTRCSFLCRSKFMRQPLEYTRQWRRRFGECTMRVNTSAVRAAILSVFCLRKIAAFLFACEDEYLTPGSRQTVSVLSL